MPTYVSKHKNLVIGAFKFKSFLFRTENPAEIQLIESSLSWKNGAVWRSDQDASAAPNLDGEAAPQFLASKAAEEKLAELGLSPVQIASVLALDPGTKVTKRHIDDYLRLNL